MPDSVASKPHQSRSERKESAVRASQSTRRFLRIADVQATVGLSSACIYKLIKLGGFPKPVKLTTRSSAWLVTEVEQWVQARADLRGQA